MLGVNRVSPRERIDIRIIVQRNIISFWGGEFLSEERLLDTLLDPNLNFPGLLKLPIKLPKRNHAPLLRNRVFYDSSTLL
ncbi:hypothetical protein [Candidatus Aquicultor sp.]